MAEDPMNASDHADEHNTSSELAQPNTETELRDQLEVILTILVKEIQEDKIVIDGLSPFDKAFTAIQQLVHQATQAARIAELTALDKYRESGMAGTSDVKIDAKHLHARVVELTEDSLQKESTS